MGYTLYMVVYPLYSNGMTGFRCRLHDTADLQPPIYQQPDYEDHRQPEREDNKFHGGQDQAAKDSAISDFLKRC